MDEEFERGELDGYDSDERWRRINDMKDEVTKSLDWDKYFPDEDVPVDEIDEQ